MFTPCCLATLDSDVILVGMLQWIVRRWLASQSILVLSNSSVTPRSESKSCKRMHDVIRDVLVRTQPSNSDTMKCCKIHTDLLMEWPSQNRTIQSQLSTFQIYLRAVGNVSSVVINLFNFFRHYKSPPFHTVVRIHRISLSYHILDILPTHFSKC